MTNQEILAKIQEQQKLIESLRAENQKLVLIDEQNAKILDYTVEQQQANDKETWEKFQGVMQECSNEVNSIIQKEQDFCGTVVAKAKNIGEQSLVSCREYTSNAIGEIGTLQKNMTTELSNFGSKCHEVNGSFAAFMPEKAKEVNRGMRDGSIDPSQGFDIFRIETNLKREALRMEISIKAEYYRDRILKFCRNTFGRLLDYKHKLQRNIELNRLFDKVSEKTDRIDEEYDYLQSYIMKTIDDDDIAYRLYQKTEYERAVKIDRILERNGIPAHMVAELEFDYSEFVNDISVNEELDRLENIEK